MDKKKEVVNLNLWMKERVGSAEAEKLIGKKATECGSPCYLLAQSFEEISFLPWIGQADPALASTFSGRIFGPQAEVRWIKEGDDRFRLWLIKEVEESGISCHEDEESGTSFHKELRRYYLWGEYKKGQYKDSHIYRGQPLPYPLPPKDSPKDGDRAFLEVALYYPKEPDAWPDVPDDIDRIEQLLNQPRIAHHRFIYLDVGRDKS